MNQQEIHKELTKNGYDSTKLKEVHEQRQGMRDALAKDPKGMEYVVWEQGAYHAMQNTYFNGINPESVGTVVNYLNNLIYKLEHRSYDSAESEARMAKEYIERNLYFEKH